jgi:hypothetical protein
MVVSTAVVGVGGRYHEQAPAAEVTGDATLLYQGGVRTFKFKATEGSTTTVSGDFEGTRRFQSPADDGANVGQAWWRGTVICLAVAGSEAWIAGVIEEASIEALVDQQVAWRVRDGGDTGDRLSMSQLGSGREYCSERPLAPPLLLVDSGTVSVRSR